MGSMGKKLFEQEPVFRETMEQCAQAMKAYVDWSLLDQFNNEAQLDAIDVIQPTLFAIQVSLAALWRSWALNLMRLWVIAWGKLRPLMWREY